MIIQTKTYSRYKFFRNPEPALMTKKDGSQYLITYKRGRKKITLIKAPLKLEVTENLSIN